MDEAREFRASLADAYLKAGKLDEAAKHFDKAIELAPDDPEAWASLATVREKQGRLEEAITLLEKALEELPEHTVEDSQEPESTAALRRDLEARLVGLRDAR